MLNRRDCLRSMLASGAACGLSGSWASQLGAAMRDSKKQRHLIVLWMPGGPSQMDTFDMKPGHANGGSFKEIETSVPGLRFSEHLPRLAKLAQHLALVRSMQTKEGDHSRGTFLVRTGHRPGAPVKVPSLPAALSQELTASNPEIPDYVSILPNSFINPAAFSAGFLGAGREPLTVGGSSNYDPNGLPSGPAAPASDEPANLRVDNLLPPDELNETRLNRRKAYWDLLQSRYGAAARPGAPATHDTVYRRAMQLAESPVSAAFDLTKEKDATRRGYGNSPFGQGCLLARRLIEQGVPVVEVSLSGASPLGWDSHVDNFKIVQSLSEQLDLGWSQLMLELEERGLLESTTIAWMGEFGRTPQINPQGGRDHFPDAWSCVLGGGGIKGGAIIGKTSDDGKEVVDRPVTVPEFLATIATACGVDPHKENISDERRPFKIVDGKPIEELLG